MSAIRYYLDTCIWLNLWKREENLITGVAYWKIAKEFIEKVIFSENEEIVYSGFFLKELKFKLKDEDLFREKLAYLKGEKRFWFVKAVEGDYDFARKFKFLSKFELSFYDCIHIALCKRLKLILVTRDRALIRFAQKYIQANTPENLLP